MNLSDFKQDFSSSAFKIIDRERRIVGKFCEVSILDDGTIDVWIVTPERDPIGNRKLNNLETAFSTLKGREQATYVRLTGEAYLQTTDKALVREVAVLCGVKRKKRYSEQTLQKKREQLANIRLEASA